MTSERRQGGSKDRPQKEQPETTPGTPPSEAAQGASDETRRAAPAGHLSAGSSDPWKDRTSEAEGRAPASAMPQDPDAPAPPLRRADQMRGIRKHLSHIQYLLTGLFILFLLWSVYVAKTVALPVVLGFLIALTLSPLVRWLARKGVAEGLSAVTIVLTIGLASTAGLYMLRLPAQSLIAEAPQIQQELRLKLWDVMRNVERLQDASEQMQQMASGGEAGDDEENRVVVTPATGFLQAALGSLATSGTVLVVSLLFAMFLLSMGDAFRARLVDAFPDFRRKRRAARISRDVEQQISRYLGAITVINAGLGLCIGVALHLMGMPYALLWGVAAFLLNYLPYLGAMVGVAVSGAVAVVTYDSLGAAFLVPLVYLGLTSIEGQMVTPWLVGRHLRLNAAAVFIAVVFWAWLWGAAGALLAVPILVVIKVLADHLPGLSLLGAFLEGRPRRKRGRRRRAREAKARRAEEGAPAV